MVIRVGFQGQAKRPRLYQEGKRPLFEKSGAKTPFMLGLRLCRRQRPQPSIKKFFVSFCSQKEVGTF
jgi:hypothetical protein